MCPFSNIYLDFHQEIWKDALIVLDVVENYQVKKV